MVGAGEKGSFFFRLAGEAGGRGPVSGSRLGRWAGAGQSRLSLASTLQEHWV